MLRMATQPGVVQLKDIPKLRGRNDYAAWKLSIEAVLLILDAWKVIDGTLTDPFPLVSETGFSDITPEGLRCVLNEKYIASLEMLGKRKEEFEEEKRRLDYLGVGWMALSVDPALLKEMLELGSKKRDIDGMKKVVGLSGVTAKELWGWIKQKMMQSRRGTECFGC